MELHHSKNQLRAEVVSETAISFNSKESPIDLNGRLSKIEFENSQQKKEISLLKKTVAHDKTDIERLTTTVDQLKGRIVQLESSTPNHNYPTIDKNLFNGNRYKREVEIKTHPPGKKIQCADSSRLCTFSYPDHPDIYTGVTKSPNSSSYKRMNEKIYGPPTSCKDLNQNGHSLSGMYLVHGAERNPNKILAVYCNFNNIQSMETLIGNVEVKSTSVHFYVQRQSDFVENAIVPYEVDRLNVGGALNLGTGIFIAPVPGIYHFGFSCLKHSNHPFTDIWLQLNGVNVGIATSNVEEGRGFLTISLHASLKLKKGDRINIYKESGSLRDNEKHYTHFFGWLVEEDLTLLATA